MPLKQTENTVFVEGILSAINLEEKTYKRDGVDVPFIGGDVIVKVKQEINGVPTEMDIPLNVFAPKMTKAGTVSKVYLGVQDVMEKYTSIAASSEEEADRVRISGADLRMNEFATQDLTIISRPAIHTNFINKAPKGQNTIDKGEFEIVGAVASIKDVLDSEGNPVEPRKIEVKLIVPQYRGIDVIPFTTQNPEIINYFENNINQDETRFDTIKVLGKLNFSTETFIKQEEVAVGEPREIVKTRYTQELVITGASDPYPEEASLSMEDIRQAKIERDAYHEDLKSKRQNQVPPAAQSPTKPDYGF